MVSLIMILLLPQFPFSSSDADRIVVIVSDSPILKKAEYYGLNLSESSKRFEPLLKNQVEQRLNYLEKMGGQFRVVDIMTNVLHGAIIETSQSIEKLESMTSELKLYRDISMSLHLEKSSELVRANEAHILNTTSGEPLTGRGIIVAILDTGIDYTHPDLGGTIGVDQKILKGYDFVDEDEDPIDRDGHGTEVAGIIAADGRIRGIAPEASLLAYRVVDKMGNVRSSDLIRALEKASKDGADVINLSLGTTEEMEALSYAINNIVESGIVVVAATGNAAERAFGEPAGRKEVIAVGASLNNVTSSRDAKVLINPGGFELISVFMNGSIPAPKGVTGSLVYVKYAREQDVSSLDLSGKIALAERYGDPGELVYFSEKEANVAARGAIGLIIHNSEDGPIFLGNLIGPHNPPDYKASIPVVALSSTDGISLREELKRGTEIEATILTNRSAQWGVDRVALFSSKGPVSPFYIKPDIVAPGVSINTTTTRGEYNLVDGTSFAAPHVSGAVALLLQAHPELNPEEVVGILAPSSKVLTDQWKNIIPSFTQGSGRLDVFSAVTSPIALVPHNLIFHLAPNQYETSHTIKIIQVYSTDTLFSLDIYWNYGSNISLNTNTNNVDIDNTISEINITASFHEASAGYYEGRITLKSSGNYSDLTIPVIVYVNEASLEIEQIDDVYKVSVNYEEEFAEANLDITSPKGDKQSYILRYGESVPVDFLQSGEYWIEAEIQTSSGPVFARGVYDILYPSSFIGVPLRFLEIFGSFILISVVISIIIITVNRTGRRDQPDNQL